MFRWPENIVIAIRVPENVIYSVYMLQVKSVLRLDPF